MKLTYKKDEDVNSSDWDFDFSIYNEEDVDIEVIDSIKKIQRPIITGLRSRFSNGEKELERMSALNELASKYAIQVASRTQELPILWKFYGVLDELWESFRNIYGSYVNTEINDIKTRCRELLKEYSSGTIHYKVHNNLLYLRSKIYQLKQFCNLGFEVERVNKEGFSKSKRQIQE